ncbi:MAG: hypothetical protein AABZ63_02800 [Actinomycetota bacterium]
MRATIAPSGAPGKVERVSMWYIVEAPRFFLINLFATIAILTILTFGIPPLINWLMKKMHQAD